MAPEEKKTEMWGARLDRRYRVSPQLCPGYQAVRSVPLSPWLPLAPSEFIVLRRLEHSPAAR